MSAKKPQKWCSFLSSKEFSLKLTQFREQCKNYEFDSAQASFEQLKHTLNVLLTGHPKGSHGREQCRRMIVTLTKEWERTNEIADLLQWFESTKDLGKPERSFRPISEISEPESPSFDQSCDGSSSFSSRIRRKAAVPRFSHHRRRKKHRRRSGNGSLTAAECEPALGGGSVDTEDSELISLVKDCVIECSSDGPSSVKWSDIIGVESAKRALQSAIILPAKLPLLSGPSSSGVLLFGPPGTGKTECIRALCALTGVRMFNVPPSAVLSKWRGQSVKFVRALFAEARRQAPSIIFFDEIDSLGKTRSDSGESESNRQLKSEMLIQMDGLVTTKKTDPKEDGSSEKSQPQNATVTVVGATNHPWSIDSALLRRFHSRVYVPLPNHQGRADLFKHFLQKSCINDTTSSSDQTVSVDDSVDYEDLAQKTEHYSGADIRNVCANVLRHSMTAALSQINVDFTTLQPYTGKLNVKLTHSNILKQIDQTKAAVSEDLLKKYSDFVGD